MLSRSRWSGSSLEGWGVSNRRGDEENPAKSIAVSLEQRYFLLEDFEAFSLRPRWGFDGLASILGLSLGSSVLVDDGFAAASNM